jgi:hypothetical protein
MELTEYASTPFGAARRTPGRHGYVAYFPAAIPRSIELPAPTIRLLADAEASLGRLAGVGQLVPNPYLLIQPYLMREARSLHPRERSPSLSRPAPLHPQPRSGWRWA